MSRRRPIGSGKVQQLLGCSIGLLALAANQRGNTAQPRLPPRTRPNSRPSSLRTTSFAPPPARQSETPREFWRQICYLRSRITTQNLFPHARSPCDEPGGQARLVRNDFALPSCNRTKRSLPATLHRSIECVCQCLESLKRISHLLEKTMSDGLAHLAGRGLSLPERLQMAETCYASPIWAGFHFRASSLRIAAGTWGCSLPKYMIAWQPT